MAYKSLNNARKVWEGIREVISERKDKSTGCYKVVLLNNNNNTFLCIRYYYVLSEWYANVYDAESDIKKAFNWYGS